MNFLFDEIIVELKSLLLCLIASLFILLYTCHVLEINHLVFLSTASSKKEKKRFAVHDLGHDVQSYSIKENKCFSYHRLKYYHHSELLQSEPWKVGSHTPISMQEAQNQAAAQLSLKHYGSWNKIRLGVESNKIIWKLWFLPQSLW